MATHAVIIRGELTAHVAKRGDVYDVLVYAQYGDYLPFRGAYPSMGEAQDAAVDFMNQFEEEE